MKRAGIERVDALGRSVHFHSFRKTWQSLGVRYGINQRVAQEVLGHSDANLTAKVYTDVPALALHTGIAKLPWIDAQPRPVAGATGTPAAAANTHTGSAQPASNSQNAQRDAQKSGNACPTASLADLCDQFVASVNVTDNESFSRVLLSLVTSWQKDELAARAGIEPATAVLEAAIVAVTSESVGSAGAQHGAQKLRELAEVLNAWWSLPPEMRAAVVTMVRAARKAAS